MICSLPSTKLYFFGQISNVGLGVDSPVRDVPCIFPFTNNGVTHRACTVENAPDGIPWCSTRVNDRGIHRNGNYGHCNENCPVEGRET